MSRARSVDFIMPQKNKNKNKNKNRTRRVRSVSPETNLLKKLFEAVNNSDVAAVRRLVERGAIRHKDIPFHMQYSEISSMKSAIAQFSVVIVQQGAGMAENALEIFRILRDGGLDYSEKTIMPEVFVSIWQEPEIFEELINNRYDVNAQHFRGHTMLMDVLGSAVRNDDDIFTKGEYTDLINRLFDLGADINIQDEYGLDALMIATGHEALDEFWYKYYGGGLGNEIEPEPYYVELLLENLKRTRQRYEFTNAAQNGDDGDEYTLEESLDEKEDGRNNNNPQAHRETVELIRKYKLALRKPTKSSNFGMVRKLQTNRTSSIRSNSNSRNRSRSRSRSSGASEGGAKKKTKRKK
jgi:hypothetical protein